MTKIFGEGGLFHWGGSSQSNEHTPPPQQQPHEAPPPASTDSATVGTHGTPKTPEEIRREQAQQGQNPQYPQGKKSGSWSSFGKGALVVGGTAAALAAAGGTVFGFNELKQSNDDREAKREEEIARAQNGCSGYNPRAWY